MSCGRQFKELSTDTKIISIPMLYRKVIHIEVEGTLRRLKKEDLEKTGFESLQSIKTH